MEDPRLAEGEAVPSRYSIAFFCNPNQDVTVECLPTCATAESPPKYKPIKSLDYLLGRLREYGLPG